MPSTYVPRGDLALCDWAVMFAARLTAEPGRFGRTAAEAAAVQQLVDAFAAALPAVAVRQTRTVGAVVAKEVARKPMVAALRRVAQRIRRDAGVSAADKRTLGLAAVDTSRSRIPVPATAPQVIVAVAAPNVHVVRYSDSSNPTRRAKPPGVVGMQLFVTFSDSPRDASPPLAPEEAAFRAFVTRQKKMIAYSPAQRGRVAHYFARWQNRRGEAGPWSAVTSLGVAG